MQTRVFQLKLRTVNRGKAERLEAMQHAFTDAVRLHLDTAYALPKPSVNSLHAACYHAARERFPLPASTIQQARDKALAIYRGVQTRKHQGKKTSRPRLQRLLPLRLAAENLRLFVEQGMVRVTTPDGLRKNRQAQAAFQCCACGYSIHADLNAARNLAAKGACSSGVGSVTEPLSREMK